MRSVACTSRRWWVLLVVVVVVLATVAAGESKLAKPSSKLGRVLL